MTKYPNLGGNSSVFAYEIGADFIRVQFIDESMYLYNNGVTGSSNVAQMKALAVAGRGLNSYIQSNVRKAYARKER